LEQWAIDIGSRFDYHELRHLVEFSGICSSCAQS
jgi:hypothetical protein